MKRPTFNRGIILRVFLILALVAGMASFPGRGARAAIDATSFATKVDFSTGFYPTSVAIGDLDGDGQPDLATANYNNDTVSVLRNTSTSGNVSFAPKVGFGTGTDPYDIAIGDLDADGQPDLAVANYGSNTVSVLLNTSTSGSVSFTAKVDFGTGNNPISVTIGDLDGDGKPDLAVANYGSNTVSVRGNTSTSGSVSFAAKSDFSTGTHPISVTIGDLDGDSQPDLAVVNAGSDNVSVLRNTHSTFADVPTDQWYYSWVERLYAAGITSGCSLSPLLYCPDSPVTRAQMAKFLEKGINGSAYTPPLGTGLVFVDVPLSYWAVDWIEQLYADGITSGCILSPLTYCPDDPVTRAQMAKFLMRAEHGAAYTPPDVGASTGFNDVSTSYWAAAWIKQLAAEGITSGCGGGNYCPDDAVTRAQMAKFLVLTFNLP